MTTYLERLKARTREKHTAQHPTKPTEGAFGGFVSDQSRRVSENDGASKYPPKAEAADFSTRANPPSREADEDLQVAFAERAAISEVDGGLPRSHAELIALTCTVPLGPGETLESRDAVVIHFASYLDRLRRRRSLPAREPGDAA